MVLDTAAVLAYARGDLVVGEHLSWAADHYEVALIPATCLAAAYRDVPTGRVDLLDVLRGLEHVVVAPLPGELCPVLGGWARTLGLDAAHAAIEAAARPPTPILTDRGDLIRQILPKDWPITDVD